MTQNGSQNNPTGNSNVSRGRNTYSTLFHWQKFKYLLVLEGILVGMFAGWTVVLYRFLLEKIGMLSHYIYAYLGRHQNLIPLWLLLLLGIALLVQFMVNREPMIKGSGIPQVEGVLARQLEMNWWKVVLGKLCGGSLALGAGLSLGREGPSIQLGAAIGQGVSRIFKRPLLEENYLLTGGASAGLAAAFNAPLAGVMFALEEVHKNFSPLVLLTAMAAALTADFVSKEFFGMKPVLFFPNLTILPLQKYWWVILLGVIAGVLGAGFNFALLGTQNLYSRFKRIPDYGKMMITFGLAGCLGFILPEVLGGGHELIVSLVGGRLTLQILLLLVVVKFGFTMISYGSGAPGGIFLPMLAIGALIGCIYGHILSLSSQVTPSLVQNFIILAMAGFFTAVVRSPITGCILISEMTGSLNHLLSLAIVSGVAYVVAELLNSKPIYESLLTRILRNKGDCRFVPE